MTSVLRSVPPVADPSVDQITPTSIMTDEQALIGAAVLATRDILAVMLAAYRPSDLSDPKCRFVDDVLRRMVAADVPVDQLTVVQFARRHGLLADGAPRLALAGWLAETVAAAPVPLSGTWYAAAVVETSGRRTIRAVSAELRRVADAASAEELEQVVAEQAHVAAGAVARIKAAIA